MKLFTKVASLLLTLTSLLCFASCSSDNVTDEQTPEGMKIATCAGEDFRLYVPTVWNESIDYGISGAYYNLSTQSTVSAKKYPITEDMRAQMAANTEKGSIQWFWETYCLSVVKSYAFGNEVEQKEEPASAVLGKLNAKQYHYYAKVNGVATEFLQVVGEKSDAFYVLTFTMDETLYTPLLQDMQNMIGAFSIPGTPYEPEGYQKVLDENAEAPEGMKLASNKDVAYFFYVPTSWKVEPQETVFAAYVEEDRTSISVAPYMPAAESMSVAEYFEMVCKELTGFVSPQGFTMVSNKEEPEKVDLGGRQASVYVYTCQIGGQVYYYKQWIAAYKSMIYAVTYTASSQETFDAHLTEADAIVSAFEFR